MYFWCSRIAHNCVAGLFVVIVEGALWVGYLETPDLSW